MKAHFTIESEHLLLRLSRQGAKVAEAIGQALDSFNRGNTLLAQEVIRADKLIDEEEIRTEEECLKLLALYQPVAVDLRTIISVLKISHRFITFSAPFCHTGSADLNVYFTIYSSS